MYHTQITKPVTCIYTDTRHPTVLCHRHNTIISIFFIRFNRHNVLLTFNDEDILHGLYGYQIIKINNIYNIYNTLRQVTVSARRSHGDNWTIVHIGKERLLPTNDRPPLRHVTEATRRTLGKAHNPDNGWAVPIRYPTMNGARAVQRQKSFFLHGGHGGYDAEFASFASHDINIR